MKKIINYFLIATIFLGCNQNERSIVEKSIAIENNDFNDTLYLKNQPFIDLSDSLFRPNIMFIHKNYLFINENTSNNLMHIVDLNNEAYIGKRGQRGAGPEEALNVWHFFSNTNGEIGIFDIELGKILIYDIDSLLLSDRSNYEYTNKKLIYSKSIGVNDNDLYFLGNMSDISTTNNRLYKINLKNKSEEINSIGSLPKLNYHYPNFKAEDEKIILSNARLVTKNNTIAIPYNNIPILEIYNTKSNKKITISGPDPLPDTDKFGEIYYYFIPYITDKYIYITYIDNREKADYNSN